MPASAPSAALPSPPPPPYRPLAIAAVVAAIGHAVLIWGIPRLHADPISGLRSEALETRIIAAAPEADEAQTDFQQLTPPPPAPPASPPEPAPPPRPTPAPSPDPAPQPEAAPDTPAEAPTPAEPVPSTAITPDTAAADPARSSIHSLSEMPSLIAGISEVTVGGSAGPRPVPPMLTGNQTKTVLAQMSNVIEGLARLPRSSELIYTTTYMRGSEAIPGRTTLSWHHDKHYYDARWVEYNVKLGNDSYRSSGAVAPQGLAPVTGAWDTTVRNAIRFNHADQIATITPEGGAATQLPASTGTQDRISAILQIGALIGGQPERFPTGTRIAVPVLHRNSLEQWTFTVEAEESLTALSDQPVPTVRLVYEAGSTAGGTALAPPAGASAPATAASAALVQAGPPLNTPAGQAASAESIRRMVVWLGPTLDFLPVRWRIEQANGNVADHLLRSAVEQRVLSSLPPPADSLPGQPAPAASAASPSDTASKPAEAPRFAFPESGGG